MMFSGPARSTGIERKPIELTTREALICFEGLIALQSFLQHKSKSAIVAPYSWDQVQELKQALIDTYGEKAVRR